MCIYHEKDEAQINEIIIRRVSLEYYLFNLHSFLFNFESGDLDAF